MRPRVFSSLLLAWALLSVPATGQTPALEPDLQGHWLHDAVLATHSVEDGIDPGNEIIADLSRFVSRSGERYPIVVVDPADGRIPYQSAAARKREEFLANHIDTPTKLEHIDPHARSLLDGVPRANYDPAGGLQIVQVPGYVLMLYEVNHGYRVIPMDGRPHAGENIKLWIGDSRGHWEGNTLVVDVTNQNDRTWIDGHGSFHSDALHVVERWTLVSPNRIDYEVTIDDPKVFTRPWKMAFAMNRRTEQGYEQLEDSRFEGERDVEKTLEGGRRDKEAGRTGVHDHRRAR